jgi:predicted dithiol-disulfide oxidoreductase (DUF899 family)
MAGRPARAASEGALPRQRAARATKLVTVPRELPYSCYSRGLDMLNGAYHFLDLVPKGRDEDDLPSTMAWLRRRDEY